MIQKSQLLSLNEHNAGEISRVKKELFNLRIDVSTAIAHVSNMPNVNAMSNKEVLDAIFKQLTRVRDGE